MMHPKLYSENLGPYADALRELYEKHSSLIRWNSEPESVMDLGIGDGKIAKEVVIPMVPKPIKEFVGIDISQPMLDSAEATIRHEKFKTFKLDAATYNLPNEMKNRFHHIFSSLFFHHVQNTRQAFRNIYDMLIPGGQLIFIAIEKMTVDFAYDLLDEGKWKKYNNRQSISPFYRSENPKKEYESIIKSLGFVDCHLFSNNYCLRALEKSIEDLHISVNVRLNFVEEEDREEYMKDYIKAFQKCEYYKIIKDEEGGENMVEITRNLVSGVITKPL